MKVYCFQSFAALTFILSFVVRSVNFRIFFTTLLFIAVVCHTSLFASFSLIVLGNLPEFRRRLLRLAENLTVDVDAQISLFEVMQPGPAGGWPPASLLPPPSAASSL